MDSTDPRELRSAGEPDDETIAAKKRSRRVSFAETTAVHVFDRDEDFETPPTSAEAPSDSEDSKGSAPEEDDNDDEEAEQEPFIRDMDSSSPGSAVGSVTSNDDDNFFGPVSASFIKSGRLSESGMSDDNNDNDDITLDSTAFSLHFRNIVPSDDRTANSAGSIRTPTREMLPFGPREFEANTGSTAGKSNSSMSLIVENPRRYDYGNTPPTLKAILAEVNKSVKDDMHIASGGKVDDSNAGGPGVLATTVVNPSSSEETKATGNPILTECCKHDHEAVQSGILAANAQCFDMLSPSYCKLQNNFVSESDSTRENGIQLQANVDKYYSNSSPGSVPLAPHAVIFDGQQLVESKSVYTPKVEVQPVQSSLQGSISSLRAKRQHLFLPESNLKESPAREEPFSSLEIKLSRHSQKLSAIKNHISKFHIPETPIFIDSRPAMDGNDIRIIAHEIHFDENIDDHNLAHIDSPVNANGENLLHSSQKPGGHGTIAELNGFVRLANRSTNEKNNIGAGKSTNAISCGLFSLSETNLKKNLLTSHDPVEQAATPNMYFSSQRQNAVELKGNHLAQDISSINMSSNVQLHENILTACQEGLSTPEAGEATRSSSLSKKNGLQASVEFSSNEYRNLKTSEQLALTDDSIAPYNSQEIVYSCAQKWNHDMDIDINENLTGKGEKLPARESLASSCEHTEKEMARISDNNSMQSNLLDTQARLSAQGSWLHDYGAGGLLCARKSVSAHDTDMVGVKRKIEQIQQTDKYIVNEIIRAQKSPKHMHKAVVNIPESSLQHHAECSNEACDIGGQTLHKHWTDIVVKVLEATRQPLSSFACNLTSDETDIMEGILDKLQMARKYERLCTSLKGEEHLGDPKQRRIAESRFLQDKLLFERAKLQLKRWKLDLLSSKAKLSQSGVRECLNLKSKFSQLRTLDTRACQIQLGCIHFDSTHSNSTYQEEQRNNLLSKKQELEILDQKVKCLKKSFKASCRIKGNLESDEILKVVNEHLEMRKQCMIVRQDLQLWELSDIVKTNEQIQLVLNYQSFVLLRFTINTSQGSIIVVDNLLNDTNIEKSFPKMNAGVAFAFIFKTEGAHRLASSKCFQQETLVASLLLGTVLDVLGEINASRRELLNLIDSGFHSECSSQLELHICFLNFKRAWKVTLSLDVTELNCAIYPSKASELHFRIISGDQTTMPISVLDKITGAIQSLQDGQLMILRLCRCISKAVHALS